MLGDSGRDQRAARPHQRRLIPCRHDQDRARQPFGAERVLDEVAHLPAALAEQRDHVYIRRGPAGAIMPSSVLLPTPLPAKIPIRWPRAEREQPVDRADAGFERLMDHLALERVRRLGSQRDALGNLDFALPVDGVTKAVQDAAEQVRTDIHPEGAAERLHAAPRMKPVQLAERHQEYPPLVKADGLGEHRFVVRQAGHAAQLAEPDLEPDRLDHQADNSGDPAVAREARGIGDALEKSFRHGSHSIVGIAARERYRRAHRQCGHGPRSGSHPAGCSDPRPSGLPVPR